MVIEGAVLADGREYQDGLAEARRKGLQAATAAAVGNRTMAEQQLEQKKQRLQQQLLQQQREAHQEIQAANTREERAQEHVQQLQKQVSRILNTDKCDFPFSMCDAL